MLELLITAPYLRRALVFLAVLGVCSGLVGVLVTLRGREFHAEALVHAVFPGLVAGLALGGTGSILPGALVAAAAATVALTFLPRGGAGAEAGTAVILASFYGAGATLSLALGDHSGQLEALMFGRLLDITPAAAWRCGALCLIAAALMAATWRTQVAAAFEPTTAQVQGARVRAANIALNVAIALIVVAASSAVGVLLVLGFLVLPGLTAKLAARSVPGMVAVAIAVSLIAALAGMALATAPLPVSPQAAVSLALVACLGVAIAGRRYV